MIEYKNIPFFDGDYSDLLSEVADIVEVDVKRKESRGRLLVILKAVLKKLVAFGFSVSEIVQMLQSIMNDLSGAFGQMNVQQQKEAGADVPQWLPVDLIRYVDIDDPGGFDRGQPGYPILKEAPKEVHKKAIQAMEAYAKLLGISTQQYINFATAHFQNGLGTYKDLDRIIKDRVAADKQKALPKPKETSAAVESAAELKLVSLDDPGDLLKEAEDILIADYSNPADEMYYSKDNEIDQFYYDRG